MKRNTLLFKELSNQRITISATALDLIKIKHIMNKFTFISVLFFTLIGSVPIQAQ